MALKPCRECGKQISTGTMKCPHCGAGWPTKESAQMTGVACIIVMIIICGIILLSAKFIADLLA